MADPKIVQALYDLVKREGTVLCRDASTALGVSHDDVVSALKSLEAIGTLASTIVKASQTQFTHDGLEILGKGSPECILVGVLASKDVPTEGVHKSALTSVHGFSELQLSLATAQAMRLRWINVVKSDKKDPDPLYQLNQGVVSPPTAAAVCTDETRRILEGIAEANAGADAGAGVASVSQRAFDALDAAAVKLLKSRKLIAVTEIKSFRITAGPGFARGVRKPAAELTLEMMTKYINATATATAAGDAASDADTAAEALTAIENIKPLNFSAKGLPPPMGALHPLLQIRRCFVDIFVAMGFQQMDTKYWCENSFYNFDALFQPQNHPARDAHDTFFVAGRCARAVASSIDKDYVAAVKAMHEHGSEAIGSAGYRYVWSLDEALRNIMRTHTTSVSARILHALGQEYARTGVFTPRKYFSIDRVYRNETLDATHLCEFHQVEGFVLDYNLTLGNLIAMFKAFFAHLGLRSLKFKPTYNPYTAPSMEIFAFHPQLQRWIEVGNSGFFRPEMLAPMGLPADARCMAWGLSLERPTMIKYGISNIRDLIGPGTSIDLIHGCEFFLEDGAVEA